MLQLREVYVNEDKGHQFGDSGWYVAYTENLGELFRSLQREYGRCMSCIYQDTPDGTPDKIGWYFCKHMQYEDCQDTYVQGVWVTYRHVLAA